MKTNFIKKLATLTLSVFAIGGFAQCPTMTGIYVQQGTGTATVAAAMTPSNTVGGGNFNWSISPSAFATSIPGTNNSMQALSFSSTGIYTVCAYYTDSITTCSATACTTINVTSTVTANCNASFTSYTNPSNCQTYFSNTSSGSNLSYKWYKLPGFSLVSTQANPTLSLTNGSHTIALYTYSSGIFCDSAVSTINVSCPTSTCNAAFTSYTNPNNCMTYFTNASTGSNLTYQWYRQGIPGVNTQPNPVMNLGNGSHTIVLYTLSNGQYCDSVSAVVTVTCSPTGSTSCQVNSQFSVFADSVNAGNYFAYNQSTGNGTLSYLWNFGDGTTSTQQYPFHQYATPGQYVICLWTTSTTGSITCTDVSCDSSSVQRIAAGYLMNSIHVKPQGATALEENEASKNLSVYPNPVENQVTVELKATSNEKRNCVITDALGKVVAEQELSGPKTIINTTTLERGIYFLTVAENGKVVKTIKLIK